MVIEYAQPFELETDRTICVSVAHIFSMTSVRAGVLVIVTEPSLISLQSTLEAVPRIAIPCKPIG